MQRFLIVVFNLLLSWAALDDPPFKFHFHEPGRYFGNPMGAVRFGDKFHFYFATPLEDPTDPGLDDHVMGAVGYATTSDLVHWERQWPVVQPAAGCFIDGGSVIEHDGKLVMYYAHRCCDNLDCPTVIFRATSTDGMWWTEGTSVINFDSDPYLTLPCVVYESARSRWVMTLFGAQDSNGYQPSFYHSPDGLTWTEGGIFVPSAVEEEEGPAHFVVFRNNFLMPMEGKWVMMGTRPGDQINPVAFIGTLNEETAVFEPNHINRGRELFNEGAESPFPVWNHDKHDYVVMNILRPFFDGVYKPLSLPVAVEAATGSHPDHDYDEYLVGDWPDEVKGLIIPSEDEPREELLASADVESSSVTEDRVFSITGKWHLQSRAEVVWMIMQSDNSIEQLALSLSRPEDTMWLWSSGASSKDHLVPLLEPFDEEFETEFAVFLDLDVIETMSSGFFWRSNRPSLPASNRLSVYLDDARMEAGWTFDAMRVAPVVDRPESPPTPPPPTTTTEAEVPPGSSTPASTPTSTLRPGGTTSGAWAPGTAGVAVAVASVCLLALF